LNPYLHRHTEIRDGVFHYVVSVATPSTRDAEMSRESEYRDAARATVRKRLEVVCDVHASSPEAQRVQNLESRIAETTQRQLDAKTHLDAAEVAFTTAVTAGDPYDDTADREAEATVASTTRQLTILQREVETARNVSNTSLNQKLTTEHDAIKREIAEWGGQIVAIILDAVGAKKQEFETTIATSEVLDRRLVLGAFLAPVSKPPLMPQGSYRTDPTL
jgi:hypothetical protein